ncbi:unnamed protein product [Bubo scandiacus]
MFCRNERSRGDRGPGLGAGDGDPPRALPPQPAGRLRAGHGDPAEAGAGAAAAGRRLQAAGGLQPAGTGARGRQEPPGLQLPRPGLHGRAAAQEGGAGAAADGPAPLGRRPRGRALAVPRQPSVPAHPADVEGHRVLQEQGGAAPLRCVSACCSWGAEIHDTPMVLVDRTLTDICFESAVLFSEAGPDFELKVELPPRATAAPAPSCCRPPTCRAPNSTCWPTPSSPWPRCRTASAPTTSPLPATRRAPSGCRSTAACAVAWLHSPGAWPPPSPAASSGCRRGPRRRAGPVSSASCAGTDLLCYRGPGEAEAGQEPALTIAVNKETRIRATEREGRGHPPGMAVTNRYGGEEVTHTLLAESRPEAQRWMEAFWQHFYDMSQWKQCCDELMRIEVPPPRRAPAVLPTPGLALPRDGPAWPGRAPPRPAKGSCCRDNAVSAEIRALLSSYYSDR